MKKNYRLFIVVASFLLMASGLTAQTSEEGQKFAKYWLNVNCVDGENNQRDRDNLIKYKDELEPYFVHAMQRGLEPEVMLENETALGQIYDQNIKMLNENKPAWITQEYENKIRSVSREAFINHGKETLAQNYKARALKGLQLIKSLSSR